jgi:hypothetical protein
MTCHAVPYEKTIGLLISCISYITAGKICGKMAGMKIGISRSRICQRYRAGIVRRWPESRAGSTQTCQRNQLTCFACSLLQLAQHCIGVWLMDWRH